MKKRLESESLWHGLVTAIVEDEFVDNDEIKMLYRLLCQHKHIQPGPLYELKLLIERICKDNVVTSREREELLQFLRLFVGQMTPHEKGQAFESFIITCFDNKEYDLIEWRSDKFIPEWGAPVSAQWPDLVMEHKASGGRFAIECKFRSEPYDGKVKWARPEQMARYLGYEAREGIPVYLALGLGGSPASPDELYMARLVKVKDSTLTMKDLDQFRTRTNTIELDISKRYPAR